MERYDLAIVGSGPAGLSAALNAKIRNKKFIIFGSKDLSNKIIKAPKINNYLGFYGMNGAEVKDKFAEHIDHMGIEITEERINNIYAMGDYFTLMVNDKMYEATAVILATGMEYTKPIKGEIELLGKGVGYCATCDAPLYRGKTVSIIGYNKEAEEEANYVSELAGKVYYVPMYKGEYEIRENIEIVDGHINVDREMKCNIPGCFAAGDCVGKPYQYIKSAGEGNIAALSAVRYIDIMKNK